MSSRFFHGGDSDSESSSSDEEQLYSDHEKEESEEESEEEEDDDEDASDDGSEEGRGLGASRFLQPSAGADDDSDESEDEDRERVVKSAKDKRLEELEATIKAIDNAEKIGDWAVISTGMRRTWIRQDLSLTGCRIRQAESTGIENNSVRSKPKSLHQKDC